MLNKDELVSQLGNIIDVDTIQGVTVSNPIRKIQNLEQK
mgnify:CR=1 FL=1